MTSDHPEAGNINPDDGSLSYKEANVAMYGFLESYCKRSPELPLVTLVSGMSFMNDNVTADPTAWHDWKEALERLRKGQINCRLR